MVTVWVAALPGEYLLLQDPTAAAAQGCLEFKILHCSARKLFHQQAQNKPTQNLRLTFGQKQSQYKQNETQFVVAISFSRPVGIIY